MNNSRNFSDDFLQNVHISMSFSCKKAKCLYKGMGILLCPKKKKEKVKK